jgi:hypothetical protein
MCRIVIDDHGKRILNFDPRSGGYGKNPAQLPPIVFPHPDQAPDTLAKVLVQIKSVLNRQTTEQAQAVKEQEEWAAKMETLETPTEAAHAVRMAGDKPIALQAATARLLALATGIVEFNEHVLPLMKSHPAMKRPGAEAAKARGWVADKKSGLYVAPEKAEA